VIARAPTWLASLALVSRLSSVAVADDELPAEGVVAVVGGPTPGPTTDVVLLSDVELRARIELAVASDGSLREVPRDLLAATLEEIIGEILVAREATRLGTPEPSEGDIGRERERLVASVGGESALTALLARADASSSEIDAIAIRRARVAAFFRANLEGSSDISDAQLEAAFATGTHPFGDRPLEEIREAMRAWLATQAVRRDVRRWLEVLRARTVVRVLFDSLVPASPDAAPDASAPAEPPSPP
jgi:hypothetical protein